MICLLSHDRVLSTTSRVLCRLLHVCLPDHATCDQGTTTLRTHPFSLSSCSTDTPAPVLFTVLSSLGSSSLVVLSTRSHCNAIWNNVRPIVLSLSHNGEVDGGGRTGRPRRGEPSTYSGRMMASKARSKDKGLDSSSPPEAQRSCGLCVCINFCHPRLLTPPEVA